MKKSMAVLLTAAMGAALLTGCGSSSSTATTAATTTAAPASEAASSEAASSEAESNAEADGSYIIGSQSTALLTTAVKVSLRDLLQKASKKERT